MSIAPLDVLWWLLVAAVGIVVLSIAVGIGAMIVRAGLGLTKPEEKADRG